MISELRIPKKYQPYLRIGTCSWKYDSWKGLVYDRDKHYSTDDYLADYARLFDTVEIDQWFWSLFPQGAKLPDSQTVKFYAESVPDDFLFTIKVPNSITLTHYFAKQLAGHSPRQLRLMVRYLQETAKVVDSDLDIKSNVGSLTLANVISLARVGLALANISGHGLVKLDSCLIQDAHFELLSLMTARAFLSCPVALSEIKVSP